MRPCHALLLAGGLLSTGLLTPSLRAQTFTVNTMAGGSAGADDGLNAAAQFSNPTGVAVDGAGHIYVADQRNNAIRQLTPQGTNWSVTTIAGGTQGGADGVNTNAQFFGPTGLAVDPAGVLYVADQFNDTIRQITVSGTNWVVATIAGQTGVAGTNDGVNTNATFANPTGIAVDGAGNLFVADEFNNRIRELTPSGTNWTVSTIAGGTRGAADGTNAAAQFFGPSGVAVDAGGNVFVADQFNNSLRLLTPSGTNWVVTTIAGQTIAGAQDGTGTNAQFNAPVGVAVDASGFVYVGDLFNNAIRKARLVGPSWEVSTIAGGSQGNADGVGTNAQFFLPFGVAVDAFGDFYVADSGNDAIRQGVSSAAGAMTGSLEVTLTPPAAVTAGARWRVDGGAFQTSAALLSGLTPGDHTLSFKAATGFTTPAVQTVTITTRQTNVAAGNYASAIAHAGSLQVLLSPPDAVNAGAAWQVDSGALQTNGAIVAGLSLGSHSVSFAAISGWTTPSTETVTITNASTTLALGTYALQTGSLEVTILPAEAVTAGAKWQVDGGAFHASGANLSGLLPGLHTLSFNTLLSWSTPMNQTIAVTNAETTMATGVYVQQVVGTGSVQVTILPPEAVSAGAQWRLDGSAAMASGTIVSNLAPGLHALTFTAVADWVTPVGQVVGVTNGLTTSATGTYTPPAETGSLQVTIFPSQAVIAGAEWEVDGGAFQASAATLNNLRPGDHTVRFKAVAGWTQPASEVVAIQVGQTTTASGTYRAGTDKTKPTLAITNAPPPNAHLTSAVVVIKGKAADNVAVDQVLFQLNNGGYQPATGTTSWSASLVLTPGPNVFDVKAVDTSGNSSAVVARTFDFIVTNALMVMTNGSGKITPVLNGKPLDVGFPYALTAMPNPGNLFSNWSGSLSSTNAVLHFMMQSNMVLQANFVPNPFIPQAGIFNGLFYDTNGVAQQSSGFFTLALAQSGAFSGKIALAGGTYGLSGKFDLNGHASLSVPRAHLASLTLNLQLDFSNDLAGVISDGAWSAMLTADRAVFNASNNKATNFAGRYTMAIAGSGDGSLSPAGDGCATLSVSSSGIITMTGNLADGTAISQTVGLGGTGQWPLYVSLYKGGGAVLSWITFSNQPASTLGGALNWIRAAGAAPKLYTAGFTNMTAVIGSEYKVTNGAAVLSLNDAQATLSGLPLNEILNNSVSLTSANVLDVVAGGDDLKLSLNKTTGLITGTFHLPVTGTVTPIKAVVLQGQNQAAGYFLGISQGGLMLIPGN